MNTLTRFVKTHRNFTLFSLFALAVILVAVFAPLLTPQDPLHAELKDALLPPSAEHWFGTDALGRDVFSRVVFGTRTSVSGTLLLVAVILLAGTLLGILAGFFGGFVDTVIMRLADTTLSFPDMILAMAVAGILGPNMVNAIVAIAIVSWTKYARLARSLVLKIRGDDYIAAARVTGSRNSRILFKYLLPNALPTMVITAATDIGAVMLMLASLSFLGFGIQPPTPEWGQMLSEGRDYFLSCPWLLFFPGLAMFLVVVVFNLLGDSLRDVLDPKGDKVPAKGSPEDMLKRAKRKMALKIKGVTE